MATRELAPTPFIQIPEVESAPQTGADFYIQEGDYRESRGLPGLPPVLDLLLEPGRPGYREMYLDAPCSLHEYMKGLLQGERDKYERNKAAAWYARNYHEELDIDSEGLDPDQQSSLILSRLYLSAVNAHATLGMFIDTGRWMGRKSEEFEQAKLTYLEARKYFQEDSDTYLDHFATESTTTLHEALMDTVNMARLLVRRRSLVDAESDTDTFVFIGSVMSERIVKIAMQRNGHADARYADEHEEVRPIRADVVAPKDDGDLHIQVKMKWKKPKPKLKLQPNKQPPHIIIPMKMIRSEPNKRERKKLRELVELKRLEKLGALQTGVDELQSEAA